MNFDLKLSKLLCINEANVEGISAKILDIMKCHPYAYEKDCIQMSVKLYLTIGSCFSVHYRVMEHAGSLESTKEAQELPEAIAEGNSSFLSALQTSPVLHNSIVHS